MKEWNTFIMTTTKGHTVPMCRFLALLLPIAQHVSRYLLRFRFVRAKGSYHVNRDFVPPTSFLNI